MLTAFFFLLLPALGGILTDSGGILINLIGSLRVSDQFPSTYKSKQVNLRDYFQVILRKINSLIHSLICLTPKAILTNPKSVPRNSEPEQY